MENRERKYCKVEFIRQVNLGVPLELLSKRFAKPMDFLLLKLYENKGKINRPPVIKESKPPQYADEMEYGWEKLPPYWSLDRDSRTFIGPHLTVADARMK